VVVPNLNGSFGITYGGNIYPVREILKKAFHCSDLPFWSVH
jgi:hypothetical protein